MGGWGLTNYRGSVVAKLSLCLGLVLLLANCAHVETFSLSLDPMGAKPPPRGYVAFCQKHPGTCQGGVEQTVVFTRERWAQLVAINELYNTTVKPETDEKQFGVLERWDFPEGAGDCEDYVLAKKAHLTAIGWPKNSLLIAVVDIPGAPVLTRRHAVLLALTDLGYFVLDNRHAEVKRWTDVDYVWVAVESTSHPSAWQGVTRSLASR